MPAVSSNDGLALKQIWAGEHVNCGVRADGMVVLWGVGDFVEAPARAASTIRCIDLGFACMLETGGTHRYNAGLGLVVPSFSENSTDLDVALTPGGHLPLKWYLQDDRSVESIVENRRRLEGTFTKITGGEWGACGIRTDGTMFCERAQALDGTFTDVSVGGHHVCGVETSGSVRCGGQNNHGQSDAPKGAFKQVSAGREHTCALAVDGSLRCWGAGSRADACRGPHWDCGQSAAPAGTFTEVRAGAYHTCALRTDGRVICWGRNERGQATAPQPPAYAESPLRCGLSDGKRGEAVPLRCWTAEGSKVDVFAPDVAAMVGSDTNLCVLLADGRATCMRGGEPDKRLPPLRVPDVRFANLSVIDEAACGTTSEGKALCFAPERWAQAPIVEGAKLAFPAPLATLSLMPSGEIAVRGHAWAHEGVPAGAFKKLCGGGVLKLVNPRPANDALGLHACGLTLDGRITCWGQRPQAPPGRYEDLVCGDDFVCGRASDGSVDCGLREGVTDNPRKVTLATLHGGGRWACGKLPGVDKDGYAYDCALYRRKPGDSNYDGPKGPLLVYGFGAGVECGKLLNGETRCWGKGVPSLKAPAEIQRPAESSLRRAKP